MRITEIRISQKKNLGDYENRELGMTAVIDETENPAEAIDRLGQLCRWELCRPELEAKRNHYEKRLREIEDLKTPEAVEERGQKQAWLDDFAKRKADIASLVN